METAEQLRYGSESAAGRFRRMLERNHALAQRLDDPQFPRASFDAVQGWQRARIRSTYADFLASPDTAAAGHFFLEQLYGGLDFRERDQEVAHVEPLMSRLLPGRAVNALAEAFQLQAMSLELDMDMACLLHSKGDPALDAGVYRQLYLECGEFGQRAQQIDLIHRLGLDLVHLVTAPLLLRLVRLMRGPALAAGFSRLQRFLEEGIGAFRKLKDPVGFVETIHRRELGHKDALVRGNQSGGVLADRAAARTMRSQESSVQPK